MECIGLFHVFFVSGAVFWLLEDWEYCNLSLPFEEWSFWGVLDLVTFLRERCFLFF